MTAWQETISEQKARVKRAWEAVAVSRNLRWKLQLKRALAARRKNLP